MSPSTKLINLSSRQLHAFLEICRLQTFAKAAEQIHLSPSGMSMLVKEMEEQVGARLFDRTTRCVTLTSAGTRLQPVAERIVAELRVLATSIEGTESTASSRLVVAATPMISANLLPDVVRKFSTSHPLVNVQIVDVDAQAVRQRVMSAEADIGLGFFVKPAVGRYRQSLCKFRLMRIRPPGSANGAGEPAPAVPWSSIADDALIGLPIDNPIQALIEKQLVRLGRANEERPRMNLIGTLVAMVRAGRGSAIIPSFAMEDCLAQGLGVAMLREPVVDVELYSVARCGTQPKPAALAFADALRVAAAKLPG